MVEDDSVVMVLVSAVIEDDSVLTPKLFDDIVSVDIASTS